MKIQIINLFVLLQLIVFANISKSYASTNFKSLTTKTVVITNFSTNGISNSNSDSYFSYWSYFGEVPITLSNQYNNMYYSGNSIDLYYGKSHSAYSLSVNSEAHRITGYDIYFRNSDTSKNTTITPSKGSLPVTCSGNGEAVLNVSGLDNIKSTTFEISTVDNANVAARVSKIIVYLSYDDESVAESDNILFDSKASTYPYRIPALAVTRTGDILAFSDYRPCGADIGYGDVDIHLRISKDNGLTWGAESKILDGTGSGYTAGYGDAAVVADRESDRVRLLCVTGEVKFSESGVVPVDWWNPLGEKKKMRFATILSEDNGRTWSKPVDITDKMYSAIDVKGMFFTSGRIIQSKQIKTGNYYRIYSVLCAHNNLIYDQSKNINYVCYSDDFGETWKCLEGVAIDGGDEAKCEELPNGNLMVSTRMAGGRKFNIFTYTDKTNATGSWDSSVIESDKFKDVTACNGEILIVDAHRTSDNQPVKLLLHSLSRNVNGMDRSYVSIYHKELDVYATPSDLTKGWSDPYVISEKTSAYSTMMPTYNDKIAFFFEDEAVGGGYQMTYYNLDLREITGNNYYLGEHVILEEEDKLNLENGEHIGDLEINADPEQSGQVVAKNGGANVDEVTLHYTVKPGSWNFISFPMNCNLDMISNLNELGFYYNTKEKKSYYLKEYSEEKRAAGEENNWISKTEPVVEKGKGYLFGVARNNDNPENLPIEVVFQFRNNDLSDYINNMDANMTSLLSYSETGEEHNRGWNLLGNPYFSNMNPTVTNSFEFNNLAPFVYQYNPNTDSYLTFKSGTNEVMAIPPFSAFFVQAIGINPSVLFHNTHKNYYQTIDNPTSYKDSKFIRLELFTNDEDIFCDRTDIYISKNASDDFILGEDAVKMWGGISGKSNEFSTISENKFCSVNSVTETKEELELALNLHAQGKYIFKLTNDETLDEDDIIMIYDKKEGIEFNLRENIEGYIFNVTDIKEAQNRFSVKICKKSPSNIIHSLDNSYLIITKGSSVSIENLKNKCKIMIFDVAGNMIIDEYSEESSWNAYLECGIYFIKIKDKNKCETKKISINK